MKTSRRHLCFLTSLIFLLEIQLIHTPLMYVAADQNSPSDNLHDFRFTVAWITDTQYYSKSHPEVLQQTIEWINNETRNGRISFVAHTGDIVDSHDDVKQWKTFTTCWENLIAENYVIAGNHDNDYGDDWTAYDSHFPNMRYYYKSKDGYLFLFISYSLGRDEAVKRWLRNTIQNHNEKIIVLTHQYLSSAGQLTDDGVDIEGILSEFKPRIFSVWCGHSAVNRIVQRTNDNVFGILHDFQSYKNGGNGYIVLVDMYESGFYMHLHSVVEGFDGKGKGQGYELTVLLPTSGNVDSADNGMNSIILVAGSMVALIIILALAVGPQHHRIRYLAIRNTGS